MKSKSEVFEVYKRMIGSNLCARCMKKIDDDKVQCDQCEKEGKQRLEKIFGMN